MKKLLYKIRVRFQNDIPMDFVIYAIFKTSIAIVLTDTEACGVMGAKRCRQLVCSPCFSAPFVRQLPKVARTSTVKLAARPT